MSKSFVITKAGYYLLDESNNIILDENGKPVTFKEKEAAENYLKEKNITGTVK
jgi:hypothetical protein